MAEYNVKINVKTDTGYDQLYPKSKSDIIDFDKTSSNLSSTNVEAAIKEVNTKANTNKTNIGTLTSLTTNSKTNLVGAINEVDSHANTAQSTANTNKTNIGTLSSLKTAIKTSIVNAINWLYDNVVRKANVIDSLDDILANQADGMVAGAKAVAELNGNFENIAGWNVIKYPNGIAMCWRRFSWETYLGTLWKNGMYFATSSVPGGFPITFFEIPTVLITPNSTNALYHMGATNITKTSFSLTVYSMSQEVINTNSGILVIGRWK